MNMYMEILETLKEEYQANLKRAEQALFTRADQEHRKELRARCDAYRTCIAQLRMAMAQIERAAMKSID